MSFVARIGILDVIMHDENRFFLETTPGKLFLKASIPGAIGMMASNIYFSVEMLLVGRLCGSEAFAAGNLALPLVYINFALADMVSVGSSVKIAIRLGEGKKDEANRLFTTAILTAIVLSTLSSILLVILSPMLFHLMGAGEHLLDDAMAYLVVYAIFCPITSLAFVFDNFLKISGKVRFSMFANIAMSVMSLLFDIIFLYVLDKGIGFAALGTSLGMALTVLFSALPFFSGKLTLRFTKVRLSLKPLKDIFAQGVPNFLNNISTKLTSVIMNSLLLRLGGEMAVSVYGVFMNLDGVIVPGMYGVFDSLQPAIGYNWGAGKGEKDRILLHACNRIDVHRLLDSAQTLSDGDILAFPRWLRRNHKNGGNRDFNPCPYIRNAMDRLRMPVLLLCNRGEQDRNAGIISQRTLFPRSLDIPPKTV